jgi:S-DNA-T family DNA segregation ATPase FtsK/SpoIIIE
MATKDQDKRAAIILKTFDDFGIKMELEEVKTGPAISHFIFHLVTSTRMKDLDSFDRDLSLALGVFPIHIAPIPDTSLIGIEIPNKERVFVDLQEMWNNKEFLENRKKLLIPLGRTFNDEDIFVDLDESPHLLITGSTGSGKSNFLHCLINSLIRKFTPSQINFILVDAKQVEFSLYKDLPYLLTNPIVETNKSINALRWTNNEMERRFKLLEESGSINIKEHNKKAEKKLPFILIISDEYADAIQESSKVFQELHTKVLQMGKAVGLHVILATSRPSKDVVRNMMCANLTSRISFGLANASDSKEVLGITGAEKLLGNGDALFQTGGFRKPVRLQTPYISPVEITKIVEAEKQKYQDLLKLVDDLGRTVELRDEITED